MVIQPEKDYPKADLARGEIYRINEALPGNTLVLQRQDGTTTTINPRKVTQLSVYHLERAELSVGDTVRINRNDPGRDLTNGDRMRVAGVIGGTVQLESVEQHDGRPVRSLELLANRPLHLEHAYASTVHSAQGLTNNRAMIALDTRSRTTSMNLYYVAISRARHEARIYTNSINELPAAIARRFDKSTALAIQRERHLQRREAGMQPKGAPHGKQLLQNQLEKQRTRPASEKKPSEYGRFG
jgi:ATP-dependent exoDNAse (exonuclease V) alpha subunit